MDSESINLQGMQAYITQTKNCAFLVRSGTIYVYIVPWTNQMAGRRVLLCECAEGSVIPALVFCDRDYQQWRFAFVAAEQVELQPMPNCVTSILLRRFCQRAGLSNYAEEGFENSVVEYYQRQAVKDDVFIERGKKQAPLVKGETYSTIQNAFLGAEEPAPGDSLCYKAVAFLCKKLGQTPERASKINASALASETVPSCAQAMRLICRQVGLDREWYQTDCGCLIVTQGEKQYACFRSGLHGYRVYDPETEKNQKLSKAFAETIETKAYYLGKTLPDRALKTGDLLRFAMNAYEKSDLFLMLLLGFVCALTGLLLPMLNRKLFDDFIPTGRIGELTQLCVVVAAFMIGGLFFSIVKRLSEFRLQSRIGYAFQDAAYYRLFRLPETFFRAYDSADLAQRVSSIGPTVSTFVSCAVLSVISALFSGLYLIVMFRYSPTLARVSLLMLAICVSVLVPIAKSIVKYDQVEAEESGAASAKLYQYLSGIEKIRMAGVEDRALLDYMRPFSTVQAVQIKRSRLSSASLALTGAASTVFSLVLYYIMIRAKLDLSVGVFVGFHTALGALTGAILSLIDALSTAYGLWPVYQRFRPVFECASETDAHCEQPGRLTGDIVVDHVTFSYAENQEPVLDDLSFRVHPGEYLGIVGPSGCGKTTLLKLLLGFEKPASGQILFDGKDLASYDKQAFRRNLGVVLQNGGLISGSIFENVTMTAPDATAEDVRHVLETVGLKDDIDQMPMGIHTVLTEHSSTISGGQRQRILIARAIIRNPSILIFDEATSALDNLTQAAVCKSLDKMNATRIVVAHRLSTIRSCDRIVVLANGKIAEEGSYDSLMALHGLFYQLASRQITE